MIVFSLLTYRNGNKHIHSFFLSFFQRYTENCD